MNRKKRFLQVHKETRQDTSRDNDTSRGFRRWITSLGVLPGFLAVLIPVGTCPVCVTAYAGFLGALGLGHFLKGPSSFFVIGFFLLITVGILMYGARNRHGYKPAGLAFICGVLIYVGKLIVSSDVLLYTGFGGIVLATLWNAWPVKKADSGKGSCPSCQVKNFINLKEVYDGKQTKD